MKKFLLFVGEIIKIVILALAIVIPVRYFLIQPFFVRGMSMEPNFQDGQYLIVDEISYKFSGLRRSDVIVFRYPLNPSEYFIKRVVGLPNETVKIDNGQITIYSANFPNGMILDESAYFSDKMINQGTVQFILGENEYFVLGDNRQASSDSRQWGVLPGKYIVGRVWVRAWPVDTAKVFF